MKYLPAFLLTATATAAAVAGLAPQAVALPTTPTPAATAKPLVLIPLVSFKLSGSGTSSVAKGAASKKAAKATTDPPYPAYSDPNNLLSPADLGSSVNPLPGSYYFAADQAETVTSGATLHQGPLNDPVGLTLYGDTSGNKCWVYLPSIYSVSPVGTVGGVTYRVIISTQAATTVTPLVVKTRYPAYTSLSSCTNSPLMKRARKS